MKSERKTIYWGFMEVLETETELLFLGDPDKDVSAERKCPDFADFKCPVFAERQ